jgi:hypothetical protein
MSKSGTSKTKEIDSMAFFTLIWTLFVMGEDGPVLVDPELFH